MIMPRSPWLASPGWTNWAGVPVEAKVEAILRPTWPDLPMPVTMTRPFAAMIRSAARVKVSSRLVARRVRAAASVVITRRAVVRKSVPSASVVEKVIRLLPSHQVKLGTGGQKGKAAVGEIEAVFADQAQFQRGLEFMQVQHV